MSKSQEVLIERAQAEAAVAKRETLRRLRANPDFIEIFEEGYCKSEAIRLVHLKGQSNMQAEGHQMQIAKQIDAIGLFREFQRSINAEGYHAQRLLEAPEDEADDSEAE